MTGSGLGPEVGIRVHQPGAVSQLRRYMGEAGKAISSETPKAAVTILGPGDHVPAGISCSQHSPPPRDSLESVSWASYSLLDPRDTRCWDQSP